MKRTHDATECFFKNHGKKFFTKEAVQKYLRQFVTFRPKEFDEVKAEHIQSWLSTLNEAGLKPSTIRTSLICLRSFYQYCVEKELIPKNPTLGVNLPKVNKPLPVCLKKEELAQFMEAAKDHPRDRTIIEILTCTGIRVSELLNIQLSDIKWDTRQIWIRNGRGNKYQFVFLTPECEERLKDYLANRKIESPYLFADKQGNPLNQVWLQRLFNYYNRKSNLEFKVIPHTIRRTFATRLLRKAYQGYIQ